MVNLHAGCIGRNLAQIFIRAVAFSVTLCVTVVLAGLFGIQSAAVAAVVGLAGIGVLAAAAISFTLEDKVKTLIKDATVRVIGPRLGAALGDSRPVHAGTLVTSVLFHDTMGLLATVIGHLDLLERNSRDERLLQRVDALKKSVDSFRHRVARLGGIAAAGVAEVETFDINSTVERAIALSQSDLKAWGITVKKQLSTKVPLVRGSTVLVLEALLAVIENAIDAMRAAEGPGNLTIRTAGNKNGLCVEIGDTGPGIPSAVRGSLFKVRVSTKAGMGMGLLRANEIMRLQGGSISAAPGQATGATFVLTLPLSEPGRDAFRESTLSVTKKAPHVALVVDDEKSVVTFLSEQLERLGYSVESAPSLRDAWALIHEKRYDMILMDVVMPTTGHGFGSGLELLQRLRREDPEASKKVILMSAYFELAETLGAEDLGGKFIAKPFTIQQLEEALPPVG